jgi:predicted nucleic acid-binding protein
MIAYLDSSVILRIALGEPGRLAAWDEIDRGVTSALAEVECLRTLDRLALRSALSPDDLAGRRSAVHHLLGSVDLVDLTRAVLSRAAQPYPTPLGTLDAIHLATALLWRDARGGTPAFATHDAMLGLAARASGFEVLGC